MILIKDMQMPFSCDRCRLHDSKVKWKRITDE